jgi:hypothetical protein
MSLDRFKVEHRSNMPSINSVNATSKFCLLIFAPVLDKFLLLTLFLVPSGMFIYLISIFDQRYRSFKLQTITHGGVYQ